MHRRESYFVQVWRTGWLRKSETSDRAGSPIEMPPKLLRVCSSYSFSISDLPLKGGSLLHRILCKLIFQL